MRFAIEQQQASLRRDGDAHFIVDLLLCAADEILLGQEDLDVALELPAKVIGKLADEGNPATDDCTPLGRKRARSKLVATVLPPARMAHEPGEQEQGQGGEE